MSDEHVKINEQDEPGDEVEGHGKIARPGQADEGRIARPGEQDGDGDEVEAHGRFDSPKSDGKMV